MGSHPQFSMAHRWLLALLAVSLLSLSFASIAHGETFTTNDLDDANSDGTCDQGCTLRDAVDEALLTDEPDTITAHSGTHELDGDAIEIEEGTGGHRVTINGTGSTVVDANDESRAFIVHVNAFATITTLTIHDGFAGGSVLGSSGGNILNGGDLTLENVILTSGFAENDGGAIENSSSQFFNAVGDVDQVPNLLVRNSRIGGLAAGDENFADDDGGGISNEDGIVTLEGTLVEGNTADDEGGGVQNEDAGFETAGLLENLPSVMNITQGSRISKNLARDDGGGLRSEDDGEINLTDSRVTENLSEENGGGISATGESTLTVLRSLVDRNLAADAGGIAVFGSDSSGEIVESAVNDNTVDGGLGGGVWNDVSPVSVVRTTVARNGHTQDTLPFDPEDRTDLSGERSGGPEYSGAFRGGGIATTFSGDTTVVNSTVSANDATEGGGVWVQGGFDLSVEGEPAPSGFSPSTLGLTHVTLVDNTSSSDANTPGAGIAVEQGFPGKEFLAGSASLKSTLLANNKFRDGSATANCGGQPPTSEGTNLEDADTCDFGSSAGDGDLVNTNPVIGPLAANGGPTETHALLAGSPAIHAASNTGCPGEDQRNVVRPQGPACDIGAYEAEVAAPAATTTPAAPAPAQPARPRVRVAGVRRACVRRAFRVRFRISTASGVTIRSVRLTVDGRRVRTRTRSRFSVRINVSRLKAGRHRLRLVVTDSAGNRTTINRRFTKCAQRAQRRSAPRFTG